MKKADQMPIEFVRVIERMKKEGRFWDALHEVGYVKDKNDFKIGGVFVYHVKHEVLPIGCSFQMLEKTLLISSFTDLETKNWLYLSKAFYKRGDHYFVTPCSKLLPIIEPENFIKMLVHYARQMASEVLTKLDNRTI